MVWFVSLCDYLPGSSWALCACGLISGFAVLVDLLHLLVLAAGFRALRGFGVDFLLCAFVGVLVEWGFLDFFWVCYSCLLCYGVVVPGFGFDSWFRFLLDCLLVGYGW